MIAEQKLNKLSDEQANRIIEVIRNDANIIYHYRLREGEACVIGGLAIAAKLETLLPDPFENDQREFGDSSLNKENINSSSLINLCNALAKEYGLTALQLTVLQEINDTWTVTETRREQLIEQVLAWTKDHPSDEQDEQDEVYGQR